ncbi:MAG: alpha/beta hydrolase [Rhodobacteraceae bacterium]|nr:alpha/beta hydrolase [Paracoccaceae bacterium]MBR9822141.1 alpha/beta hydrolase [Paracoccaceae bacterium]
MMATFSALATGLAALAVAFALLTWLRARQRTARREAAFPPRGRFLTIRGQRLHVVQDGPTDGPDVVLLHGASANLRDLQISLLPGLVAAGFRVTLFDRPGLGHSQPCAPGRSLLQQADLLDAACAELGLEEVILCGQSFGGALAACWAVHHPERLAGLVLISAPVYPWPPEIARSFRLLARPLIGPPLAWLLSAWLPQRRLQTALREQFSPEPVPRDYLRRSGFALALRPAALRTDALERRGLFSDLQDMVARLPQLSLPVELLHGTEDSQVRPDRHAEPLRAEVSGARLKWLKGAGHMPHHTHADSCVDAIARVARRSRAGLVPPRPGTAERTHPDARA